MGKIVNLKAITDEKIQVVLELSAKEVAWLKGNMDKMHLFSENNLESTTRLVQRGKRDATKYFLLPKDFRKGVVPSNTIPCTMIDTKSRQIFIFAVNKYAMGDFNDNLIKSPWYIGLMFK